MKILIAYDGSRHSDAAIDSLRRAGLSSTGEAMVVCVADEGWPAVKGAASAQHAEGFATSLGERLHEAETLARSACERFRAAFPEWTVSAEPAWGSASKAILTTVDWWKPDLLVVGSHGRSSVARLVLGSVSLALIHHAPCAVRVVREGAPAPGNPIRLVVATDGSPGGDSAVEAVAQRTWPVGTEARLVGVVDTIVPPPPAFPQLESKTFATEPAFQVIWDADERERARVRKIVEGSARRLENLGLKVAPIVLDGDPRTEIAAEAERYSADAVFLGARGLGTLDRLLLGSVSTAVVTHAHCSVEVIRTAQTQPG